MTKLEQLKARMQELSDIINIKFKDNCEKDNPDSVHEYTRLEEEYLKLNRQYRVLCDADVHEWTGDGEMMTLLDFVRNTNSGEFTDFNCSGNYSDGILESDVYIIPSDVVMGNYRKDFTHIIWRIK